MGHGGARENSGRKHIYTDLQGEGLPTKRASIPEILNENDIQKATWEKLKKDLQDKQSFGKD